MACKNDSNATPLLSRDAEAMAPVFFPAFNGYLAIIYKCGGWDPYGKWSLIFHPLNLS
jgi:hypothetical protein